MECLRLCSGPNPDDAPIVRIVLAAGELLLDEAIDERRRRRRRDAQAVGQLAAARPAGAAQQHHRLQLRHRQVEVTPRQLPAADLDGPEGLDETDEVGWHTVVLT